MYEEGDSDGVGNDGYFLLNCYSNYWGNIYYGMLIVDMNM